MAMRKALVPQEYAGRKIAAGETFDVEPPHLHLLTVLGRIAEPDPVEVESAQPTYSVSAVEEAPFNRSMQAAPLGAGGKRRHRH